MEILTIDEFNKNYGVTTYGIPRYKMVNEEDINTYVAMLPNGQTIPYFCEWKQADTYTEIQNLININYNEIKYIIANHNLKKSVMSLTYSGSFHGSKLHEFKRTNVKAWVIENKEVLKMGLIIQVSSNYPQFDYVIINPNGSYNCITQRVGFNIDLLKSIIEKRGL